MMSVEKSFIKKQVLENQNKLPIVEKTNYLWCLYGKAENVTQGTHGEQHFDCITNFTNLNYSYSIEIIIRTVLNSIHSNRL